MERLTRGELLSRGGRVALAAGAVPFAGRLVELASAAGAGIFDELANELKGNVVVRGASDYNQARLLFSTRFDGVKPRAVVFCESLADVQRTVRWARKHAVRIVPRSGGHSYGGYSTTTGVIVDVSRLNTVRLDAAGHAVVGAGAWLIDVYSSLGEPRANRSGRVVSNGLHRRARTGWGSRFRVAQVRTHVATTCSRPPSSLPTEHAVVANAHQHTDLYWALRGGGGGNFGIVYASGVPHPSGRPGRDIRDRVAVVGCEEGRAGLAEVCAACARRALFRAQPQRPAVGWPRALHLRGTVLR